MKQGASKMELIKSLEATLRLTRAEVAGLELKDPETVTSITKVATPRR